MHEHSYDGNVLSYAIQVCYVCMIQYIYLTPETCNQIIGEPVIWPSYSFRSLLHKLLLQLQSKQCYTTIQVHTKSLLLRISFQLAPEVGEWEIQSGIFFFFFYEDYILWKIKIDEYLNFYDASQIL